MRNKSFSVIGVLLLIVLVTMALLFLFIRNISIAVEDSNAADTSGKDVINAIKIGLFGELDSIEEPRADNFINRSYEPIAAVEYFGRTNLAKEKNGDLLVKTYDKLVAAASAMETRIVLADFGTPLSNKGFEKAFDAYMMDYPQHFWVSAYSCISYKGTVLYVDLTYNMDVDEILEKKALFESDVQQILNALPESLDEYHRELWIHDYLINSCEYTSQNKMSHTSYGCLVEKQAVCDGYTKAFTYLCRQVGIHTTIAQNEEHAWNIVQINNEPYIVDVTWDDTKISPEYSISYEFFNITTEQYLEAQSAAISIFEVPKCTARVENYYIKNNALLQSCSIKELTDFLQRGSGKVRRAYLATDPDVYRDWLQENFSVAAKAAGFSGSGQTSIARREIVFILDN